MISRRSCAKYLLLSLNLVYAIFGILLVYSGFKTVAQIGDYKEKYNEVINDWPNYEAISLIVFGFVIFFIAFLGCYVAIKESPRLLFTFCLIILGLGAVEIVSAGMIFSFRSNLKQVAELGFKKAIVKYNATQTNDPINKALDDIQTHLKCCGADNYSDWFGNNEYNRNPALPDSCCPIQTVNVEDCSKDKAYASGSVKSIVDEIKGSLVLLAGIGAAIYVLLNLGVIPVIFQYKTLLVQDSHKATAATTTSTTTSTQPPQRLSEHRIIIVLKLMAAFIKQRTAQKQQQQQAQQQQMLQLSQHVQEQPQQQLP